MVLGHSYVQDNSNYIISKEILQALRCQNVISSLDLSSQRCDDMSQYVEWWYHQFSSELTVHSPLLLTTTFSNYPWNRNTSILKLRNFQLNRLWNTFRILDPSTRRTQREVCNLEGDAHPTMLALWSWTSSLQNCEK